MITKHNLKELFESLEAEQIETALNSNYDFILFECMMFNIGSVARVESFDYSEELEREANELGNLFIDKDDFLRLYVEIGANNKTIQNYL